MMEPASESTFKEFMLSCKRYFFPPHCTEVAVPIAAGTFLTWCWHLFFPVLCIVPQNFFFSFSLFLCRSELDHFLFVLVFAKTCNILIIFLRCKVILIRLWKFGKSDFLFFLPSIMASLTRESSSSP